MIKNTAAVALVGNLSTYTKKLVRKELIEVSDYVIVKENLDKTFQAGLQFVSISDKWSTDLIIYI